MGIDKAIQRIEYHLSVDVETDAQIGEFDAAFMVDKFITDGSSRDIICVTNLIHAMRSIRHAASYKGGGSDEYVAGYLEFLLAIHQDLLS
jgi:hypothetical protein